MSVYCILIVFFLFELLIAVLKLFYSPPPSFIPKSFKTDGDCYGAGATHSLAGATHSRAGATHSWAGAVTTGVRNGVQT